MFKYIEEILFGTHCFKNIHESSRCLELPGFSWTVEENHLLTTVNFIDLKINYLQSDP